MEKNHEAKSGYLFVIIEFLGLTVTVLGFVGGLTIPAIVLLLVVVFLSRGFTIVNPNQSTVLILFGEYRGTIKKNGFWWVNPLFVQKKISLRARNLDSEPIKVNDKIGNPVMIGVVMVWRVQDTFKAAFDVNDYEHFVNIQTEAAMRKLAGLYPYDNFEDEDAEITLRSGGEEVNEELEREVTERLAIAGIEVMEARINYLAYAQEIAQAMLKRQQATAIVAARFKIVEGAVGMVEMALEELSTKEIVELDEEKKATMVSNLMVVLCGDKEATPIVNTGSIY
ncbi:SPFH domain-containing protein [Sunxiuqinia elliptica]|uniref:Regulator of protease activity HflC (Stomatin/prohibitin superfamily) n=1 Tax=Sunxiuqinia elliptica TaxID=655355 RepID=A0A4R6GUL2_9BACT|nr:SPFH domain-containing protein [Sunxiuqinia elliptica]TDN99142.1 regulator of protease activity HflC (stomatin/prohibitin superfamily) [Sunxiuqinia elliptica]TDO56582.1 regulator of protease activity HflC (stomatin/prohibitin superfamily) [Sunxiuqinia elliptica]